MKRVFTIILGAVALIFILTFALGYQYLFNAVKLTYLKGETGPTIDDGHLFPSNPINTGIAQPWVKDTLYNKIPLSTELSTHLKKTHSASFLVIKDGQLRSENYFGKYHRATRTNSFSMAKSVTVMLAGAAIEDGKIKSLQEKLSSFFPQFAQDDLGKYCSLEDLASMQSGLDWDEDYNNPFAPNAKAYYGTNLAQWVLHRGFDVKPGTRFQYQSGTTQLLGFAIRKAVDMPLSTYASLKLWQPLGMEYQAYWNTDQEEGIEKAYCCINATSRDFAKLGQLLLNEGQWKGKPILNKDFVQKMITGTPLSKEAYGNGIWVNNDAPIPHYYLRGLYGQYVICVPQYQMVIVRTGANRSEAKDRKNRPKEVAFYVNQAVKLFGN